MFWFERSFLSQKPRKSQSTLVLLVRGSFKGLFPSQKILPHLILWQSLPVEKVFIILLYFWGTKGVAMLKQRKQNQFYVGLKAYKPRQDSIQLTVWFDSEKCLGRRNDFRVSNKTFTEWHITPRICMHGSDACQLSAYASEAEVKVCKCSGGGGGGDHIVRQTQD